LSFIKTVKGELSELLMFVLENKPGYQRGSAKISGSDSGSLRDNLCLIPVTGFLKIIQRRTTGQREDVRGIVLHQSHARESVPTHQKGIGSGLVIDDIFIKLFSGESLLFQQWKCRSGLS
jgi:hypothetical protein